MLVKSLDFISLNTSGNDIILDFYPGSGTTGEAVMQLNSEDGGKRKYILIQLPEKCAETSDAYQLGYRTIPEIAKKGYLLQVRLLKKILNK